MWAEMASYRPIERMDTKGCHLNLGTIIPRHLATKKFLTIMLNDDHHATNSSIHFANPDSHP
jgi:hypothetical protein